MAATSPNFNFISPVYDSLAKAVFGDAQQKAQSYFLQQIPPKAHVLIIGGGTGLSLAQLLQTGLPDHVLYLESSANMMKKARHRVKDLQTTTNVDFRLGTEKNLLPAEKFHVIITPFVLDLFPEKEAAHMVQALAATLLPSGQWLHTDFHLSPDRKNRWWQKQMLWLMYRFFRTVSSVPAKKLPYFTRLFENAGFLETTSALFYKGFIKASVWQRAQP